MRKFWLLLIISLLLLPAINAKEGDIKLLAVMQDNGNLEEGAAADLHAKIEKGNGKVFIETYPLSKIDTQISTRFAKDIACKFLDTDCSQYDFSYTVNAKSSIIGGPSAGSAIAVLTTALLSNSKLNEDVAITGTINSGGTIGPVAGLKQKIDAANSSGIKKVLIPKGKRLSKASEFSRNASENDTIDLIEYGKSLNIEVIEISTLGEALYHFTGKKYKEIEGEITIDPRYRAVMRSLAKDLCSRAEDIENRAMNHKAKISDIDNNFIETEEEARNLSIKASSALEKDDYYSAASFCFGSGMNYKYLLFKLQNLSQYELLIKKELLKDDIENMRKSSKEHKINTITDLQTYMIVEERLSEANSMLDNLNNNMTVSDSAYYQLAYASERVHSAESWSNFFDKGGKRYSIEKEDLKDSCTTKLSEAQELIQYVSLYFPRIIKDSSDLFNKATEDLENGDYELCLYRASKTKSQANTILSVFGVQEDEVQNILDQKLDITKKTIILESRKSRFPIIGYSYYEYAKSLKDFDPYSALIYSELALELSNLDLYFKEDSKKQYSDLEFDKNLVLVFILGIVVGFVIASMIKKRSKN